jgi:hypothetical protein
VRRAVFLIILICPIISSCITTPGLEEPEVFVCTIIDNSVLECVKQGSGEKPFDISIIDSIGFQCTSPSDFAKIKTHHQVLHEELNKK